MADILKVTARQDIVTDKNFTVAFSGDKGHAMRGARPHDSGNFGRVLVYFKSRDHGYWCRPEYLAPLGRGEIADFIAHPPVETVPLVLPAAEGNYEYHFGKNLKIIRDSRGLSQIELGKRMGKHGSELAQSTICYRENSAHCPGGKFVSAAAQALSVPDFIFFLPLDKCTVFNDACKFINCMSSGLCEVSCLDS